MTFYDKGHLGAQKSAVLTKKVWVENSKTGARSLFWAKKSAEKGKKAEKLRFFQLTHAFLGKKHGKGDQGKTAGNNFDSNGKGNRGARKGNRGPFNKNQPPLKCTPF